MIKHPMVLTWAMSVGAGLCAAAGLALAWDPATTPRHVFLVQAGVVATVVGALMFVAHYSDVVRPARLPPPPPEFTNRSITWRDRAMGDGRPVPTASTRTGYILSAIAAAVAAWLLFIGVAGVGFAAIGPGLTVLLVSIVHALRTRYRSVPRPPYSTWLEDQRRAEQCGADMHR